MAPHTMCNERRPSNGVRKTEQWRKQRFHMTELLEPGEKFIPGALSVSHKPQFQFQPFCILKNPLPTFLRNLGVKVIAAVSFIKS